MKQTLKLKEFRTQLNLSQLEMAKFLRTTRSQIAMVEKGGRSLQIDGMVKLANLYNCNAQMSQLGTETTVKIAEGINLVREELVDKWKGKLIRSSYEKRRLEDQVQNMKSEWEANLQLALTMDQLLEVAQDTGGMDYYRAYADEKKNYAHRKMIYCGESAQLGLQASIELLDAEMQILNKLISGK
jgi:transcriptional regulator with XRE-family HTH domain